MASLFISKPLALYLNTSSACSVGCLPALRLTSTSFKMWSSGRHRYCKSVGTQNLQPLPQPRAISTIPSTVDSLITGISSSGTTSPYTTSGNFPSFVAFSKRGPTTFSPSPTTTQSIPSSSRTCLSSSCHAPGPPTMIFGPNFLTEGWFSSSLNFSFMYASPPNSCVKVEVAGPIPKGSFSVIPTTFVLEPTTLPKCSGWATMISSL